VLAATVVPGKPFLRGWSHALAAVAALVCSAALLLAAIPAGAQTERTPVTVIGVTDGDTITVRFEDGRTERTRLIGIDTPETVHPSRPVECYGREASAKTTALALGRGAEVELDVQPHDRYLRLLAYVWIDGTMLNLRLAEEGYAAPLTIPPNVRYAETFRLAAATARHEGRGLWSACAAPTAEAAAEIEPTVDDLPAQPVLVGGNCDPSYPDVCLPSLPPDLDCRDVPQRRFRVLPPDPHRFDGDRDGVGCEQ